MAIEYEIFRTGDGSDSVMLKDSDISFHSKNGAIQESQLVFIENGFDFFIDANYKKKTINIFEVGFGTGLNALLTSVEAAKKGKNVIYNAIDKNPLPLEIYSKLNYSDLLRERETYKIIMQTGWNQLVYIGPFLKLRKIKDDFETYLFKETFDIIYFDAFAPEDQQQMWTRESFRKIFNALNSNGVIVTYCSKSAIRKIIEDVGFTVQKLSGPPGKREVIRAVKK